MNKYLKNFKDSSVAGQYDLTTYKNVSFDGASVSFGESSGIVPTGNKTNYGTLSKDLVVALENNETTAFSLKGKNITVEGVNNVGVWNKSINGNAMMSLNCSNGGDVTVENFKVTSTNGGYNCLEIGLAGTDAPKSVTIDNVDLTEQAISNNAILIFGTQNDAVINIKNVKFGTVSNCIRISNKTNATGVTVNIIDCECTAWDTDPVWAGMIIFEDYTSKSVEKEEENNLFAPEKITINVKNFTVGGKKLEKPENIADICGTKDASTQVFYVWNDYGQTVPYGDGSRYPVINIE
jgi:hypothetical protein